ncbi:Oidioi.mRNA.OKI2018_I69.chr2.g6683.t1.cds [Oikopleura dioica]|uniref:Oidioi.mRNA.OKI2018_I69.chr2.g6683.t1.cds n=1 Tax=Oikopleura dioica TaxID=34765 RepID=A0ABN7T642_OIKDI|nr:Oidioi.mRNA.OKI2018_I69.chr2.g6683.t1.cds [Oikopleura dioica]
MKVYGFLFSPPSRAVEITCKLAGVDYEFSSLNLMKGEHMNKDFLAINPRHCIPTIVDNGFTLWESRAILQFIVNQYAPKSTLYPAEPKARAKVDFWLNWDMGSMYSAIFAAVYPKLGFFPMPDDLPAKEAKLAEQIRFLDGSIQAGNFLTGKNITIADISIACGLTMPCLVNPKFLDDYENVKAWFGKVAALPEFAGIHGRFQEFVGQMMAAKAEEENNKSKVKTSF